MKKLLMILSLLAFIACSDDDDKTLDVYLAIVAEQQETYSAVVFITDNSGTQERNIEISTFTTYPTDNIVLADINNRIIQNCGNCTVQIYIPDLDQYSNEFIIRHRGQSYVILDWEIQ